MSFTDIKRNEIKLYLLRKIDEDDECLISKVADAFGISMTSVKRYIDSEISEGHIVTEKTNKCGYKLVDSVSSFEYIIDEIGNCDELIMDDVCPLLNCNAYSKRIWDYVLCEIFNNALEHSKGTNVKVSLKYNYLFSQIIISDNGVGVFKNIVDYMNNNGQNRFNLKDSVVELYKGKFTSCPERHSGEGIFFSTKLLDQISIISDGMIFKSGYNGDLDIINSHLLSYAMKFTDKGTVVVMQLENNCKRNIKEVFDFYADVDEGFIKTKIPVFEACLDRNPLSRSQARRICSRLNNFKEVILDFEKVEYMAQGFADEIFRVFHNDYPDVVLTPINMNEETRNMYLYTIHNKVCSINN